MNVKPLYDRILVTRIKEEEITQGGIIIPGEAKEKQNRGKIIAIGKGRDKPMTVKLGDVVHFGEWTGVELNLDGVECLMMNEDDVLAVEK